MVLADERLRTGRAEEARRGAGPDAGDGAVQPFRVLLRASGRSVRGRALQSHRGASAPGAWARPGEPRLSIPDAQSSSPATTRGPGPVERRHRRRPARWRKVASRVWFPELERHGRRSRVSSLPPASRPTRASSPSPCTARKGSRVRRGGGGRSARPSPGLATRELLYTAITRARRRVVVHGSEESVARRRRARDGALIAASCDASSFTPSDPPRPPGGTGTSRLTEMEAYLSRP